MPTHLDKHDDPLARHSLSPSELQDLLATERAGKPFLALRDGQGRLGLFATGHGQDVRLRWLELGFR